MGRPNNVRVPRTASLLLGYMTHYTRRHSVLADYEETYREMVDEQGKTSALRWYWRDTLKTLPAYMMQSMSWRMSMIENYIKMILRSFKRQKMFTLINILGLAIGLGSCLLISLWVQRETGYDNFHSKAHRIYRVERELFRDNAYSRWPIVNGQYRQALLDDIPEITEAVRIMNRRYTLVTPDGERHQQVVASTDNAFFEMFDFQLLEGDVGTALVEPNSVVLTPELAMKFFGSTSVVGKTLQVEVGGQLSPLNVTGLIAEAPENSSIQFQMLHAMSSFPEQAFANWRSNNLYTYVVLDEKAQSATVNSKLKTFIDHHLEAVYGDLTAQGLGIHEVLKLYIYPLTDIHLHPAENWEITSGGSAQAVFIFSTIAVLILLIACVNFVNLSTARANQRAKEVCLRKTVGAGKAQLRMQFIQESVALALVALLLGVGICLLLLPIYEQVFNDSLNASALSAPGNILIMILVALATGAVAGIYPAFYLTRFQPAHLGRGFRSGMVRSRFRRNLVMFQFAIASVLLISLFTVYSQMRYISSRPLGFTKENMIVIPARSQMIWDGYEGFRAALLSDNRIEAVAVSTDTPGEDFYSNSGFITRQNQEETANLLMVGTGYEFAQTYEIPLAAGRYFSKERGTDTRFSFLLNEAACARLGWTPEEAVGKELSQGREWNTVIGVVKDFHLKSLHREVEPLMFYLWPHRFSAISVRIKPGQTAETLDEIRNIWDSVFPGETFRYQFMEDQLATLYSAEINMQKIFVIFCVLSIFVACLGLLGLAAFTADMRAKEVGIRKVLGGSVVSVLRLLTGEFLKWIAIANLIGIPVAAWLMHRWLQGFAYRTALSVGPFAAAAGVSLLIALLTVLAQVIRTVQRNPVDVLRLE